MQRTVGSPALPAQLRAALPTKQTRGLQSGCSRASCRAGGRVGLTRAAASTAHKGGQTRPTAAETARTVADIDMHGTLALQGADGWPLAVHAAYVLDDAGQPILCVPAQAPYAAQLGSSAKCSLHVQARSLLSLCRQPGACLRERQPE